MSAKRTVGDLRPSPYNPRKITPAQLRMLAKSMAEFGDLGGLVVNTRTGNVISGHQRHKVLDKSWPITVTQRHEPANAVGTVAEGYVDTPWGRWTYREVDFDDRQEKAANLAANQHGGDFDIPGLKDILTELNDGEFDIELTGFDEADLESLINYDPNSNIKDLDPKALTMAWVLIGIPIGDYPNIAPLVEQAQSVPGAIVEVAANATAPHKDR